MADQQPQELVVTIPPIRMSAVNIILAGLSEVKIKDAIDTYMLLWQCRQNAIQQAQQQADAAAAQQTAQEPNDDVDADGSSDQTAQG